MSANSASKCDTVRKNWRWKEGGFYRRTMIQEMQAEAFGVALTVPWLEQHEDTVHGKCHMTKLVDWKVSE